METNYNGNMSLIIEFKKGTPAAFSHFYNQFYTPLYYFARKIMDDPVVAEDVIADSFLKLWQKHEQFDSEDHIKNFLYLTTKNACLNIRAHVRHKKNLASALPNAILGEDLVLNQIIRAQLYRCIYNAVECFPAECRRIFKMSFLEGMKNQEIADKLGLSVKTVKNQKARAIHLLRKTLLGTAAACGAAVMLPSIRYIPWKISDFLSSPTASYIYSC
jgi:RNA polymerase sigma-70 factor (ECF subfamily)